MAYHVFLSGHCKCRGTDTMPCLQEAYSIVVGYRKMDSPAYEGQSRDEG